jgi:hypothetical protein
MSGKGGTYRKVDKDKFEQNFDRIFGKEHEHAEAVRAFAAGEKLEFRPKKTAIFYGSTDDWFACDNPDFHHNFEYRVKRDVKS